LVNFSLPSDHSFFSPRNMCRIRLWVVFHRAVRFFWRNPLFSPVALWTWLYFVRPGLEFLKRGPLYQFDVKSTSSFFGASFHFSRRPVGSIFSFEILMSKAVSLLRFFSIPRRPSRPKGRAALRASLRLGRHRSRWLESSWFSPLYPSNFPASLPP